MTNFHKKGCWILNKSHLSSDANKYLGRLKKEAVIHKNPVYILDFEENT